MVQFADLIYFRSLNVGNACSFSKREPAAATGFNPLILQHVSYGFFAAIAQLMQAG